MRILVLLAPLFIAACGDAAGLQIYQQSSVERCQGQSFWRSKSVTPPLLPSLHPILAPADVPPGCRAYVTYGSVKVSGPTKWTTAGNPSFQDNPPVAAYLTFNGGFLIGGDVVAWPDSQPGEVTAGPYLTGERLPVPGSGIDIAITSPVTAGPIAIFVVSGSFGP